MFSSPPAQTLFHGFQIFSRARRAPPRKLKGGSNSRVAIPLAKCLFFQAFRSRIATRSGDTFITHKKIPHTLNPELWTPRLPKNKPAAAELQIQQRPVRVGSERSAIGVDL